MGEFGEEPEAPELRTEYRDKRGAIYVLDGLLKGGIKGNEINYLELRKGAGRGACYHTNDENFVVYEGKIKYIHGKEGESLIEEIVSKGESRIIPAGEIHAFVGIDPFSIVSEWGITTEEKRLDRKDPKLRALIDNLNSKLK